ncbi:hypothetical protein [Bacillus sp. SD088]|uniref:hypothetical protein n=1 Tax=Bacillus sp. SD088 TaxID=2782012 RepID=UPI001A974D56|nr:hypothetical protein [Bacillus sp. SD088]MBO0994150.1 hypothetical protein [Bacillus sp. SD088]
MKVYKFFILLLLLFLIGCSTTNTDETYSEIDLLQPTADNESVLISDKLTLLEQSSEVVTATVPFTQVKAFVPNEEYKQFEKVQGEDFLYLKLPKNKSFISGRLIYENNTEEEMIIQSLFLQGDKSVNIKLSKSKNWGQSIKYNVPPHSSVSIDIDIKWDINGMQELTFFPIDQTSDSDRYNGGNLSTYRYFVQSKNISVDNDLLKRQSFTIKELSDEQNFVPILSWIDKNKQEPRLSVENDTLVTEEEIKGIKLEKVPYDTKVDLLLVDELGNSSLLVKNLTILKNEETFFDIEPNQIKEINKSKNKQFVLVFNNREEEMLADLKALDLNKKPFFTSYQGVLEFYRTAD